MKAKKKEITIYDIAKELNISAATVSRGLRSHDAVKEETQKKIQEAARRMGYQQNIFASNLRKKKTNTIGVVVPHLNSYFLATVLAGIEKVANQAGYNLIISQSLESLKKEVSNITTMFNSRVDGLMVSLAEDSESIGQFEFLIEKRIPIVFFDRIVNAPNCVCIEINNFQAGYEATHHLLEQGCRRIVMLSGDLRSSVYQGRHDGYRQALIDFGLTYNPDLVFFPNLRNPTDKEVVARILEMNPRPDGIFTVNDTLAITALFELKRAGISVPHDIGIVGFNDNPLSRVIDPMLSSVHYPAHQMGEIAATTLVHQLQHLPSPPANTITLPHQLIIRESSLKSTESVCPSELTSSQ